jgi:short-subunit dehydrogenase
MARRFEERTVVITGASSGVGAAAARQFAAEGARVVLAARTAAALDAVAKEIGDKALVVPTDVADPDQLRALVERAIEAGGFDVLVNNAGYNHRGELRDADPSELARVLDVNLKAPILLTRLALPHLLAQERASVVNVASIAGQIPLPGEATYSATKFGLRSFSMALAEELRGTPVRVSLVSPGPIDTGFLTRDLESVPDVVFSQPMSTAEQVAGAVLDCADDGRLERTIPRLSGVLATAGYLLPELPRLIRPLLEQQGRRAKRRFRETREEAEGE